METMGTGGSRSWDNTHVLLAGLPEMKGQAFSLIRTESSGERQWSRVFMSLSAMTQKKFLSHDRFKTWHLQPRQPLPGPCITEDSVTWRS